MKKSTFIGNFVAFVALAAACSAFLAWYHLGDKDSVWEMVSSSPLAQFGVIVAAPLLLYAIGVVVGLLILWFKKITLGRGFKVLWRVLGLVGLAVIFLSVVPLVAPDTTSGLMWASVIVVYVAMVAPIMIVMFGFFYALGCAGVTEGRRGLFDKYLPDDHFE